MQMHSSANLLVKKFYQMIQVLLQLNGLDALLSQHCYIHMKGINNLKPISRRFIHRIGIIWGNQWGTAKDYLAMAQICARNIRDDYDNGIIARFHDESHINKYLRSHPCKILSQEYCWPEEWPCQFTPKIIFRDKVKFDSYFNKGRDRSWWNKIKKIVTVLYDAIRWYL